jgi:hypothetical protein
MGKAPAIPGKKLTQIALITLIIKKHRVAMLFSSGHIRVICAICVK